VRRDGAQRYDLGERPSQLFALGPQLPQTGQHDIGVLLVRFENLLPISGTK